jgi:protein-L-isoaspartate(D-aspartate) O-methyltransferase
MVRLCVVFLMLVIFTGGCLGETATPSPSTTAFETIPSAKPTSIPTTQPTSFPTPSSTRVQPTQEPTESGINYTSARSQMVDNQIEPRGIENPLILEAMRKVPRHEFVPENLRAVAYEDHPLPIGYGQTISQPFIVGLMTQSIEPKVGMRILEIGTGSGYQAAVLAELGADVYTIEIIPELAKQAAQRLNTLGYTNITTLTADGYFGWQEHAPFDAIMVTAAPDHLPQPLADQLKNGGRMVIPIGPIGFVQTLWLFEKIDGELVATNLGGVTFVPFTGDH